MTYNLATLHAATGDTLMLPGWQGQFVWNYANNTLEFRNGDYRLTSKQLEQFNLHKRVDWYYII